MPIKQIFLKKHKQISFFDKKNRMKKISSKMCKKMGKKEVGRVWWLNKKWIKNQFFFLLVSSGNCKFFNFFSSLQTSTKIT